MIIVTAAMIAYACLWKTGMLASLGTLCDPARHTAYYDEAMIFYDTDSFNTALLWLGIASLVSVCLLYVFANHKRRNYYMGNYVISVFAAVVNFGVALVTIIFNSIYLGDLADIKANTTFMESWLADSQNSVFGGTIAYSENNGMFVFGYIICVLMIAGAVFLILNMLWKRKLMQGEKELLNRGFAEEVA